MTGSQRWLVPVLLTVGALVGGTTAWRLEGSVPAARPSTDHARSVTPVLSVRRVPGVVGAPVAGRRLVADLDALTPFLPPASCLVVEGPNLRYSLRGEVPLVPASTAKLLTATAALTSLGRDAVLRTSVVSTVPLVDGVIGGDVTLVGGGDPLLATRDYVSRFRRQPQTFTDLGALATALRAMGVKRIDGSVVGDESRYDSVRYVAGWPARYIEQNAVGPLSGLSVNDGFERYPTEPAGGARLVAARAPALVAAEVLTRLLEAGGIDVLGAPRAGAVPPDAVELAALDSPPIVDVVGQMLRESDNNTAELLLKEIGRRAGDPSTAGGAAAVPALLRDPTVDLGGVELVDGSGLSTANRITCTALVDVLRRRGTGAVLQSRLAVAGRSGTLAERFAATPLEGVLRAKTGSLTSVASLAGVVEDEDPPLTFALVVNVDPLARIPDGVAQLEAQIGAVLAAWPRVPDPTLLGPLESGG